MKLQKSKIYFINEDGLPKDNKNVYFIYNDQLINGYPKDNGNYWVDNYNNKYYDVEKYVLINKNYYM